MPLHTRRKPSHGGQIATNEALLLTTDGAHRISDAVRQGTDTHKRPIIVVMTGSNIITTPTELPYPSLASVSVSKGKERRDHRPESH